MTTTKIEQEFRNKTNEISKQTITNAIDGVSYVFNQLTQRYKSMSSEKQGTYQKLAEFLDKLQKVKSSLNEINKIDFTSFAQEQVNKQRQYSDKIQQIQEAISMLNMDIVSLSQNSLYDEKTRQILESLTIPVLNQTMVEQIMLNVNLVNGDVDKTILQSEERIRHELSNIMGDIAYQITMPNMQYNPLGNITPKSSSEHVQQVLQQNLAPYEQMQQKFIDLTKTFRKQVADAKEYKDKTEYEALQIIQDKIKSLRGDESSSQVNELVDEFQSRLGKSLEEAKSAYGTSSVLEYEEKFQSTVTDAIAELITKQKALSEAFKLMRTSKADEFEKRTTMISMLKQTIITLEQKKTDFLTDYMQVLNSVMFNADTDKLNMMYEAVNDPNSQVYKDTISQIQQTRMNRLASTRLSTDLYGAIDPMAQNGRNFISTVSNEEYRNLVKNVQYQNQFINQNLGGLLQNPMGASAVTDFNFDMRVAAPMIATAADAHIDLLKATGTTGVLYNNFASAEEKQALETTISASKEMIQMIDRALIVFEKIDKDDVEFTLLKRQKQSIESQLTRIEEMKRSMDGLSKALGFLKSAKNKSTGLLAGGLGFFGVGALLSPTQTFMQMKDKMNQFGRMSYGSSIADLSMGLGIDPTTNRMLSYGIPISYFDMTYGNAKFNMASDFYKGMAKSVGGQYGGGSPRGDFTSFIRNLMADKVLYGLQDGEIQQFLKTFYKDMGMSANEAMIKFRALEGYSVGANIPMQKTLSAINAMSEGMRVLGVSSKIVLNAVTSLAGWNRMRIEDAQEMVSQTANAGSGMAKDWGRSIFWGMMNGEGIDPFDMVSKTYLSHNADGSVNDGYYDTLVDRLFTESTFFGSRWGAGSEIGTADMMNKLMEQGYSMKQSSMLVQLYNEGKLDEVKKKLKGYEELNDPMAPADRTREYAQQIQKFSEQLSETEKIQGKFNTYFYRMANLFETTLSKQMKEAEAWLKKAIGTYTNVMTSLIASAGGFLNSPTGKSLLNTFAEHPFAVMGGALAATGLAKYGMRKFAKEGIKALTTGNVSSSLKVMTASLGAGAVAGGYVLESGLMAQESQGADVDSGQVLLRMLSDGRAVARVLKGKQVDDAQEVFAGSITSIMLAGGAPILAYMFAKSFLNYRTAKHMDRIFKNAEIKAQSPKLAYPKKARDLVSLEKRLAKNKAVSQAVMNRYNHLRAAHEARVVAYQERKRANARIRRQNRMVNSEYRRKVSERMSRLKNKGFAKTIGKTFGVNVLLELLLGDADDSVFEKLAGASMDTALMATLGKRFGFRGQLLGMSISSVAREPVMDAVGSFFGTKAEASPMKFNDVMSAIDGNTALKVSGSEAIGVSNERLSRDMRASMEAHGLKYEDTTTKEKQLWQNKVQEFMGIFGDYKMAVASASQYVGSVQASSTGSYGGAMASGAQLFQQLKQKDPEVAQMMQEAAQKFGVSVEDLCVIANIESNMNANVGTNSAGATGIMQNTSDHGTGYDIYTTRGNIFAGAYYYRQLLDQFKGDKAKALAGYNWGPNRDVFNTADWYNHLPEETSNYLIKAGLASGSVGNLQLTNGRMTTIAPSTGGAPIGSSWSRWVGQHMDNGSNGCVEAVTKIGADYSPFLAQELSKGTVGVEALVANAGNNVIAFNPNAVQRGDVIVYGNNDHVVIADGNGGYIGNSSSQQKIVEGSNYNAMSGLAPTKIIKTGGANAGRGVGGGNITKVNTKPATLKDSFEQNVRSYQQTMQSIEGASEKRRGRIVNGMFIDANQKFISVEDSIKASRESLNVQHQQMWNSTINFDGDVKASQEYLNRQEKAALSLEDAEAIMSMKQQKTEKIKKIVEKVQTVVGEFFENPQIVCDI